MLNAEAGRYSSDIDLFLDREGLPEGRNRQIRKEASRTAGHWAAERSLVHRCLFRNRWNKRHSLASGRLPVVGTLPGHNRIRTHPPVTPVSPTIPSSPSPTGSRAGSPQSPGEAAPGRAVGDNCPSGGRAVRVSSFPTSVTGSRHSFRTGILWETRGSPPVDQRSLASDASDSERVSAI